MTSTGGSSSGWEQAVRRDVEVLAGQIGERNYRFPRKLAAAADYVEARLAASGLPTRRLEYRYDGMTFCNLEAVLPGQSRPDEIVIIGAHYDTALGTPGANDNASGVATVLAIANATVARGSVPARTMRFLAFTNEERPYFWGAGMGSLVYARACRARGEKVVAMLAPETMGYYTTAPHSQRYPWPFHWFYPSVGNFLGFIGMLSAARLVRRCLSFFRAHATLPCEGAALPAFVPRIVASDHSSFWRCGYPAVMITDTAEFRYPYYHHPEDTPDKLAYAPFVSAVLGLANVAWRLAGGQT
ncbi:MAG: M28 family peptidase [bacterium]|nr:M28 family peptidase [bacterium]